MRRRHLNLISEILSLKHGECITQKEQRRNLPSAAGERQQIANVLSPDGARVLHLTVEWSVDGESLFWNETNQRVQRHASK